MNREERLKFRRQNQALFASKQNGQHQPPLVPPPVPQKAPRTAQEKPEQRKAVYQRLPAGSVKRLIWTGSVWQGTLFIPASPENGLERVFTYEAENERRCFHGLHNEYAKWLKEQEAQP